VKIFKKTSPLWTVVVAVGLLFLIIQSFYIDHNYAETQNKADFPINKTIFFTVKEHQFTLRKKGFDSLNESLKLWEYDKKENNVYLREETLMPTQFTPLMVIYDRGQDTFEKQENMIPVSSFPFSFKNAGTSLQINQVDKNGKVYFQYQDKELSLEAGDTYRLPYFDGFRLKMVTIKNHGLFDSKQFRVQKQGTYVKKVDSKSIEIQAESKVDNAEVIYTNGYQLPKLKKGYIVSYSFYKERQGNGLTRKILTDLKVVEIPKNN